jgi:antitoxin ParD1/3/4
MTTLTVSLPEALTAYLQEQLASGQYSSADAYIQALIQQDKARKDHLEPLILEGLASGIATPMTTTDWESIRATVRQNQGDRPQNG